MASLNRVQIIGNVGTEPEMRFSPNGDAVVNFSVATNEKFGENEHTEWFRVVAWKKLAETCNQYLSKGRQVYVEGRLQTRKWEDNDGNTRYNTDLIANRVLFLGKREDNPQDDKAEEIDPDAIPF